MAQKLYVGNLSFNVTEDQLRTLFSEFGEIVSATLITDSYTGRARGFGFVEMENHEAAISALNGKEFEGRPLTVNIARERSPRGGGGDFNNRGRGNFHGRNRY
ncbi:MAG: RNA-binding protein [Chitinispirillaceae bacterium]|nr:RNA-binding protein [Chitinispirillaceae bacterium]